MAAPSFFNRVVEYTTTTGTGTVTTTGVAATQCSTFASIVPTGTVLNYLLLSGDQTNWEIGQATVTISGGTATLTRTSIIESTNSGAPINLTGQSTISCIADAGIISNLLNLNPTSVSVTSGSVALASNQYAQPIVVQTGTLTGNVTYVVPNVWLGVWENNSTGAFTTTVKTAAGAGVIVPQGARVTLSADGTNVGAMTALAVALTTAYASAAGTTQGTAAVLSAQRTIVTAGTGGVLVPNSMLDQGFEVWNRSGVAITVYPAAGAQFESAGANVGQLIANNAKVTAVYTTATQGYIG